MINAMPTSQLFVSGFLMIVLSFSCKKEAPEEPKVDTTTPVPTPTVSFQQSVLPIFNTHCNGSYCHGGGADGKSFNTHGEAILVPITSLLGAINHTSGFNPMPKLQSKLAQTDIDTITSWINAGRLNN